MSSAEKGNWALAGLLSLTACTGPKTPEYVCGSYDEIIAQANAIEEKGQTCQEASIDFRCLLNTIEIQKWRFKLSETFQVQEEGERIVTHSAILSDGRRALDCIFSMDVVQSELEVVEADCYYRFIDEKGKVQVGGPEVAFWYYQFADNDKGFGASIEKGGDFTYMEMWQFPTTKNSEQNYVIWGENEDENCEGLNMEIKEYGQRIQEIVEMTAEFIEPIG